MHDCIQLERFGRLESKSNELSEFKGKTEASIENIEKNIKDIKDNHLRLLNQKISWLLFTVLASVFVSVAVLGFKAAINPILEKEHVKTERYVGAGQKM